jgi:hypothetical protein
MVASEFQNCEVPNNEPLLFICVCLKWLSGGGICNIMRDDSNSKCYRLYQVEVRNQHMPIGCQQPPCRVSAQVLGTRYLVPGTWYQILGTRRLVPGTRHLVPGTRYLLPDARYQVPGTRHLVLDAWYNTWYLGPHTRHKYLLPNFLRYQIGTTSSIHVEQIVCQKLVCLIWKLLLGPIGAWALGIGTPRQVWHSYSTLWSRMVKLNTSLEGVIACWVAWGSYWYMYSYVVDFVMCSWVR